MTVERQYRTGAVWLEVLLVIAVAALVFQLFPALPQRLFAAIDVRYWSRTTWLVANIGVLLLFVLVRFVPDVIESLTRKSQISSGATTKAKAEHEIRPKQDVRWLLQRDENLRAQLRRKFVFYGLLVPILIVAIGVAYALWHTKRGEAERAANTLLHSNAGANFRGDVKGVVGIKFQVRPDRDLRLTHLGVYDSRGDGLELSYRIGIFKLVGPQSIAGELIAEAMVPYGRNAPLEEKFRWVALPKLITLSAGKTYVLASEAFGDLRGRGDVAHLVADNWPSTFDDAELRKDGFEQAWNPLLIGDSGNQSRTLLITDKQWPAFPNREEPTPGGVAHGLANLIAVEAD